MVKDFSIKFLVLKLVLQTTSQAIMSATQLGIGYSVSTIYLLSFCRHTEPPGKRN